MPKQKYAKRGVKDGRTTPFFSAEEAWFWFIRCQRARIDGARFDDSGTTIRPCEPDDIYRVAKMLVQAKKMHVGHLKTLINFAWQERVPDQRLHAEERAARLWNEALDAMTTLLSQKGIIDLDDAMEPR